MPNRPSRIEISIPTASFDGRYYGRYPTGNRPNKSVAAAAASTSSVGANLSGGAPAALAAAAASSSSATAALTTGGGGLSSLAAIVDGNPAGAWYRWAAGDLPHLIANPDTNDPVTDNGSVASWLPGAKTWVNLAQSHGSYKTLCLTLPDATTVWANTAPTPVPNSISDPSHQFMGQCVDASTDTVYFHHYSDTRAYNKVGVGGAGSSLPADAVGGHGQVPGVAFNPHMGSQGSFVSANFYGASNYDVAGGAWTLLDPGFHTGNLPWLPNSPNPNGNYTAGFYDPLSQSCFFSDATGQSLATAKITAAGVISQVSDVPVTCFCNTATVQCAMQIDGYISASTLPHHNTAGTVRKPMIVDPFGGKMYEYDSTAGAGGTWTDLGITPPTVTDTSENATFKGYCETYDCIVVWLASDGFGGAAAWVFPRA